MKKILQMGEDFMKTKGDSVSYGLWHIMAPGSPGFSSLHKNQLLKFQFYQDIRPA